MGGSNSKKSSAKASKQPSAASVQGAASSPPNDSAAAPEKDVNTKDTKAKDVGSKDKGSKDTSKDTKPAADAAPAETAEKSKPMSKAASKSSIKSDPKSEASVEEVVIEAPAETPVGRKASAAAAQPAKLFAAPEGPKHSKIFSALNPEKLWYETRREKEESKGDTVQISIRGGGAGMASSALDFQVERDEEGNILQDDEPQEEGGDQPEENFDPKNLPDFGEFQKEMDEMRAQRAAKQKAHQDELKRAHAEKRAKEEAIRQTELKEIMEREAKLKASEPSVDASFVLSTQQRLEVETQEHFRRFSFRS